MPPPAQGWSKFLIDCHPAIQSAYPIIRAQWCKAHPTMDLKLDYTWRSKDFQFGLYRLGRDEQNGVWVVVDKDKVVTDKDGTKPSHHQTYPAQAADVYITDNGKIMWPPAEKNTSEEAELVRERYRELGYMVQGQALISGAIWKYAWKDWPHWQVAYAII